MVLAVTNDKYEFPIYIERSYKAMAKRAGTTHSTVSRQCRGLQKSKGDIKFLEVREESEDEHEAVGV